jgi:16S rRNA (cytosine1402-N4)-methyltransferase
MSYHETVLLHESIEGLDVRPGGIYVDATYGGGGHSEEILKKLGNGRLIAFDQDEDANANRMDDERLTLVNANFRFMKNFLMYYKALPADGIIADLGISSHQIDNAERGFSIRFDAELDLRMDRKNSKSAHSVLAEYSEEALAKMFFEFGELKQAYKMAKAIVQHRKVKEIIKLEDLKNAIGHFAERGKENKFFAKVLQALRIEINDEINALNEFLHASVGVLKTGGRLVVISYHSLEDRPVKNIMKSGNLEGTITKDFYGNEEAPLKMITRQAIVPGAEEIERNKRARSAKLRIAEKV